MSAARRLALAAVLLAGLAASPVTAQTLPRRVLGAAGARAALAAAEAEAGRQHWKVSIAVVDPWGELLAFVRLDGAPVASAATATGKARTAARFGRPTAGFDTTLSTANRTGILTLDGGTVTAVEGGVPIVVDGQVVGAIGVSGVTSAQDAQVARAGAAAVTP